VTRADVLPVLVIGATGRIGRGVVAELLDAGVPVRALTRQPATAGLPAKVEVVAGDRTVPDSLDSVLQGVGAVFLLWTAPPDTAKRFVTVGDPNQAVSESPMASHLSAAQR
jgi:uncharacterized protein YbjT (DUF2867 family)